MSKRRVRVAEGVYRDRHGLAATVKVAGRQREHRFPRGTALDVIKSWRVQMRAELDGDRSARTTATAGTLERDGDTFLSKKKGREAFKSDRAHLRAWYPTFGPMLRSAVTRDAVEQQLALWQQAGAAARTIRHRCRVLRECYRSCDGPTARTPVDHLKLPAIPAPHPVAVPLNTMLTVARRLKAAGLAVDYARFVVRATTGQRPTQVMRATPADVDLKRRLWFVRSAKGGEPTPLPLNPEMIAAWKAFMKAHAWGPFDTARAADVLRAHGWPKDVRPYALRHTFAIDHLLAGTDLGDLQGLLGHAQIQTTRTHYAPILTGRLRTATNRRVIGF